jgi:hypothetical protein
MASQLPIDPDQTYDTRREGGNGFALAHPRMLSLESQLKLRTLYEYVESCRTILREIHVDLSLFEANPECMVYPKRASERLENFCIEADSWGFNALYEIGLGLQVLLLNASSQLQGNRFWEALNRGVAMLSALLDQCESDFRWRLAIAEVLDCFNQAGQN